MAEATDTGEVQVTIRPVILEVRRSGRRPRYHLGARIGDGVPTRPEQCNLDQAALEVRTLEQFPEDAVKRADTQLCRRCFPGGMHYQPAPPRAEGA